MPSQTQTNPPPATTPGAGPSRSEAAAAGGFVVAGFLIFGPIGMACAALAVGIERAFLKSGWQQPGIPDWLGGGPVLTPQEREARRQDAARAAREFLEDHRARAQQRAAEHKAHREAHRDWTAGGKRGDEPRWAADRSPIEFAEDLFRASSSWCRLFTDKLNREFDKFNDGGEAFFKNLWGFLTGFVEGVQDEWARQKKLKEERDANERQWKDSDEAWQRWEKQQADEKAAKERADRGKQPDANPDRATTEQPDANQNRPDTDDRPAFNVDTDHNDSNWTGANPDRDGQQDPLQADATLGDQNTTRRPVGAGTAIEGELMGADGSPVLPAGSGHHATQGTTNLDLFKQAFEPIPGVLNSITEQGVTLSRQRALVQGRIQRITSLCAANGAPVAVTQMLDHGRKLVAELSAGLVTIDEYNEQAREFAAAALAGLQPAEKNQTETHGQQATGDLYDRAGTGS